MALKSDFVVIGSGIAGLRAVVELAQVGDVLVLTKARAEDSNTEYAQGGVAVALSDDDEVSLHYEDTLYAGDGLCEEAAVRMLVSEGSRRIQELIHWGVEFDREGSRLAFTREAAHSRKRVLHAHGDSTGREINRALIAKVTQLRRARLETHSRACQLIINDRGCHGVRFLRQRSRQIEEVHCQSVLLATGGCGVLYRETTNPDVATGDGYALAFKAGALLADMEFVQFHPTALEKSGAPHFLLSEALRGEGARLRNSRGETFMERYHELADLAPRDVVSRSIFREAARWGDDHVFLDLTHLAKDRIESRFPRIYATCREFGIDLSRQPAPVFPAAHYMMGGVLTDLEGSTSIHGLFAAGEASCTGVHGANRLASNSLLEGLVFGARAARAMIAGLPAHMFPHRLETLWQDRFPESGLLLETERLRSLMSDCVGIVRDRTSLNQALETLQGSLPRGELTHSRESLSLVGWVVARSALLREESRGGHYRSDFPKRDDAKWRKHLLMQFLPQEERVVASAADRF